jgi:hypothetical protein
VKVIGVFPDNIQDPIIYPVALRGSAKPDAVRYFSFLQTQTAKSIFVKYGFNFLIEPSNAMRSIIGSRNFGPAMSLIGVKPGATRARMVGHTA